MWQICPPKMGIMWQICPHQVTILSTSNRLKILSFRIVGWWNEIIFHVFGLFQTAWARFSRSVFNIFCYFPIYTRFMAIYGPFERWPQARLFTVLQELFTRYPQVIQQVIQHLCFCASPWHPLFLKTHIYALILYNFSCVRFVHLILSDF